MPVAACRDGSALTGVRTKARNHTPIASRVPPPVAWGVARRSAGCGPACDEIAKRWSFDFHEPMYDLAPACPVARHVTQYASYTLKGMNS